MRTHVKKKVYAGHVRDQVLAGLVNKADTGDWIKSENSTASKDSIRNGLAGCVGKKYRWTHKKRQAE